jgi:hypothetical protein
VRAGPNDCSTFEAASVAASAVTTSMMRSSPAFGSYVNDAENGM